jgi:hypothetical protein
MKSGDAPASTDHQNSDLQLADFEAAWRSYISRTVGYQSHH